MKIENKRTDTEATKLFCQVPPPNFYYFFEIAILLGLAFKLEILKQQESVGLSPKQDHNNFTVTELVSNSDGV